jgi:enoyl-CoA hydratase/carnithine racemase
MIRVAEFGDHLLWSVAHIIEIGFANLVQERFTKFTYTFTQPGNTGAPTISLVNGRALSHGFGTIMD